MRSVAGACKLSPCCIKHLLLLDCRPEPRDLFGIRVNGEQAGAEAEPDEEEGHGSTQTVVEAMVE